MDSLNGPPNMTNYQPMSSMPMTTNSDTPAQVMTNSAPTQAPAPSSSSSSGLPPINVNKQSDKILEKRRIADLVKEVDPMEQLDEDVEELLMEVADDFIDNVATAACLLAKHRKSTSLDVKDVQLHLERNWNMWIPGFGSDEIRPYRKAPTTEAHKQRLALIKKNMKKY